METRVRTWEKNRGTASVERGPLTYSLKIKEDYRRSGGTDTWPAFDIMPASPWNYALVTPASLEVVRRDWPADNQPFAAEAAPIQIKTKGRRLPEWTLDQHGLVREVQQSPVRTTEPEETITLIPLGAARLRISAFPVAGAGPDAHVWTTPTNSPITASHCFESDTVEAVNDGIVPRNSADRENARFTWWPHRGTSEWLQWTFGKARAVGKVEVYWFDDTGSGSMPRARRVPARIPCGRGLETGGRGRRRGGGERPLQHDHVPIGQHRRLAPGGEAARRILGRRPGVARGGAIGFLRMNAAMGKPRILVIGSSNTDMIMTLDRIPRPGETILGAEFVTAAGGKGANQAVAAARAGGEVKFVARVGRDMFGEQAVARFVEEGINVEHVVRDNTAPSGVALIFLAKDGENSIAVAGGSNRRLSPADVRKQRELLPGRTLC